MKAQATPEAKWTVLTMIKWTTEYLTEKGIDTARLDGELLLSHMLGMDRTHLYMNFDQPLTKEELAKFRELVKRRGNREPLQYITAEQEFWSMPFKVAPGVLIPRPETELLVEEGVKSLKSTFTEKVNILDVGTGSGALAAALAKEVKDSKVTAVDFSKEALALATENIELNELSDSVTLLEGDLFEPVEGKRFHLIVSNPPYIPKNEIEKLQPEVSKYEPASALDGGADGLDFYRKIIPEAINHLEPQGWLMVEHGAEQSGDIVDIFKKAGRFNQIEALQDLAGLFRIVKGQLSD